MTRQQKLVDAILQDGKAEASKLIKKAEKQAKELLDEQKIEEQKYFDEQIEILKNEQMLELETQILSQNLQKSKIVLKAESEVLKQVYDATLEKLKNISSKDYSKFMSNVLSFASNGNEIIVANEKDKKLVQKLEVFKTKKLKIYEEFGDFSGGAIIISKTKDIDFSFESLLIQKFENDKFDIVKQLF